MSDDELREIEDALHALVSLAVTEDLRTRTPGKFKPITVADLMNQPIPTRRDCAITRIIKDPLGGAARNGIQLLGERLFEITGSTNAMREVAERVAERDPNRWGHRINILDKRWDGIGNDKDMWVA